MRKLIFIVACCAMMSCEVEQNIVPEKIKIGCICNDGTYVVWDENIMKQTGWTTGNPCWDKGGILSYTYNK